MASIIRGGDNFDSGDLFGEDGSGNLAVTNNITQSGDAVPRVYTDDTTGSSGNLVGSRGVTFTGIPSWARRIDLVAWRPSLDGANDSFYLQIGDSGGIETSGYLGICNNASGSITNDQTLYWPLLATTTTVATRVYPMSIRLFNANPGTNTQWTIQAHISVDTGAGVGTHTTAGFKTLSGALTQIKYGLTGSTDTFDNGSVILTAWGY